MFRKKDQPPPPPPRPWPAFDGATATQLERCLTGFFAARTIADCQAPIEDLLKLADVNITPLETTGRSLWSWYIAWLGASPAPDARSRVQFALFVDEYHDSFARQANPMAVAVLGTAAEQQLNTILGHGFDACGALDPSVQVIAGHPVAVGDLQRAWSQQLGRPVEHPTDNPGESATAPTATDVVAGVLADAEAGDESQQALVAAVVAQQEGRTDEALGYLEHGARLGNVEAMLGAADLARELGRHSVDRYWTETAANAGSPVASFNMGLGALNAGDLAEASRWLQTSANQGNGEAYAALIEVADREEDSSAQARWAEMGAQLNHPRCLEVHALNILRGNEQNPEVFRRALALMESAAGQGYAAAMDRCGIFHYHSGNPTQAKYWWEQAIAAGDQDARQRLVKYGLI
jgi:hypothetical protein